MPVGHRQRRNDLLRVSFAACAGSGARPSRMRASMAVRSGKACTAAGKLSPTAPNVAGVRAGHVPRSGAGGREPTTSPHRPALYPRRSTVIRAVQTDDLGEHMSVAGVALGAGGGLPVPVAGQRRVDRADAVSGGPQSDHPRAAVSFMPTKTRSAHCSGCAAHLGWVMLNPVV